jgi:dTDP-L-rhamnose 4-epimerase
MMKKVLITGGAGFIGTQLSEKLVKHEFQILKYDSLSPKVHSPSDIRQKEVEGGIRIADIRDLSALIETLEEFKPNIIVHLASETGTGQSHFKPSLHTETNVTGSSVLIEAIESTGLYPEYMLLTSSRAVYGEGPYRSKSGKVLYPACRSRRQLEAGIWDFNELEPIPVNSKIHLTNPCNVYGITKESQEKILRYFCQVNQIPLGIFRLQNVYGVGQSLRNSYTGIVQIFIQMALKGQDIEIYEDGNITRDFVYIDDVIDFLFKSVSEKSSGVFDVGTGRAHSILDLSKIIARLIPNTGITISGKYRFGDVRHAMLEQNTNLVENLGRDLFPLEKGIQSLIPWVEKNMVSNSFEESCK